MFSKRKACPERSRRGFTLIELLIVIAIIGILAAVIIANLSVARQKSRDAKRKSDAAEIQTALEMYAQEHGGSYPSTNWIVGTCGGSITFRWLNSSATADNCPGSGRWSHWSDIGSTPFFIPNFMSVVPVDPINNNTYYYAYLSNGTDYKLFVNNLESSEGKKWAANDGGSSTRTSSYELFSTGAQGW